MSFLSEIFRSRIVENKRECVAFNDFNAGNVHYNVFFEQYSAKCWTWWDEILDLNYYGLMA